MVYFLLIFAIICLDQISKKYIIKNLKVEEKRVIKYPNLFFWHKKNYGVAYSKLNKYPSQVRKFTGLLTIVWFVFFLMLLPLKGYRLMKAAFSMVLGGAIGNLIDRISNKCVTDFIYIKGKHAPIFNVADIFIFLGAVLSVLASFKIKD